MTASWRAIATFAVVAPVRLVILKIVSQATQRPGEAVLPFWRIGAEGGFLPKAVQQDSMLMSPAERADVIVDFTGCQGARLFLINEGPDEPFGGGTPGVDFDFADPATTGQVLKFVVDLPLSHPRIPRWTQLPCICRARRPCGHPA